MRIFISYRRTDEPDSVGRVRDRLRERYGADAIFRDIDGIPKGTRFADVIATELAECAVLVVVIGPHWLDAADAQGNRRLLNPDDWVRTEVETGLARKDIRILPVLVGGAALPPKDQLPPSLQPLLDWNAAWLRDDTFDSDFAALTHDLGGHHRVSPLVAVLGAAVAVLLLAVTLVLLRSNRTTTAEDASVTRPVAATAGSADPGSTGPRGPTPDSTPPSTAPSPPLMTGVFNVAVADFSTTDTGSGTNATNAHLLAVRLADRLTKDLAAGALDIQVRGPDEIGPIAGSTPAARDAAAKAVATQIGADVVIDARVDFSDPTSIAPNALVSPTTLAGNPELGGYYSFLPITSPGSYSNVVTRQQLVDDLSGATEALAQFIRGIGYYSVLDSDPANPGRAEQAFRAALASPSLPSGSQEGTHSFLGALALLRADLPTAKAEFEQTLAINPASTRGALGLAEVGLVGSVGNRCAAGTVDAAGLADASAAFAAISPADIDAPGAGLKARLGQARALRCRSQAGLADDFASATSILRQVIASAGSQPVLRELVALAHAELALAIAPTPAVPDPTAVQASLDETRAAIDATRRPQSKAVYLWQEAFFLWYQGHIPEASAALAEAAGLDPTFAAARPDGFAVQVTGRLVPSGLGAPTSVSTLSELPLTGRDSRPVLGLGLALLALGVVLRTVGVRLGGRRTRPPG